MSSSSRRRGRPKGSGLDDRALLRRIGEMIDADPALKPTTAIKAIGVTDPSTIRRLRDKLKSSDHVGPSSVLAVAGGGTIPATALLHSRNRPSGQSGPVRSSASRPMEAAGLLAATDASSANASAGWFVNWYALGLSAISSTVEAHFSLFVEVLHAPHIESALRDQLHLNEAVAKALCPMRSDFRTTLH